MFPIYLSKTRSQTPRTFFFFFLNDAAPTEISPLSLPGALPILHATGLFTAEGQLLCVREDVGRHNAMDKVVGWAFREQRLPLADTVLCVSGRLSFELVQKARSEEHTSELQSRLHLVCRLLLEKK